jgi:hypothetical protein
VNPCVSAATHLYGKFNFNRTPLAPQGAREMAHIKPKKRKSWTSHGVDAWYFGTECYHYQCYIVYFTSTNKGIVVDTLEFPPRHINMPHLSTAELTIKVARELMYALHHPAPTAPFTHMEHDQQDALAILVNICEEIADP